MGIEGEAGTGGGVAGFGEPLVLSAPAERRRRRASMPENAPVAEGLWEIAPGCGLPDGGGPGGFIALIDGHSRTPRRVYISWTHQAD